jgi:Xaa-Pro aminopeptidase
MKDIFNFLPQSIEAFLITTSDEFLGEYTPSHAKRLEFLTGFTGSTAFALIFKNSNKNLLFIDGRYVIQAQMECGQKFEILDVSTLITHLKKINFALDGKFYSYQFIQDLKAKGLNFEIVDNCPIDKIWQREINVSRETSNFELAGDSKEEKIIKSLKYIEECEADALFISDPHDVCYLLNIRGRYLDYSPVVPFFAIVSRETQKLVSPSEVQNLKYGKILLQLSAPYSIFLELSKQNEIIFEKQNFIQNQKIIKTEFEIECIKKAHAQDGKAIKEFANWLKKAKLENETEFTLGEKLLEFRKKQTGFVMESFAPIVGFKENGAIVHYKAKKESAKQIKGNGLLLVDSGGQYYHKTEKICGTTDITRVFMVGENANEEEKRAYTLVLKGHISLCMAVFPFGTTGAELDILARQFLWKEGLTYNHGTGHGVGYFLSVHEKPCSISKHSNTPLQAGMILSNEPGYYKEGFFGVRFENLILVKKSKLEGFLEFEVLTKAHIETKLLDYEILTDDEVSWLTSYSNNINLL